MSTFFSFSTRYTIKQTLKKFLLASSLISVSSVFSFGIPLYIGDENAWKYVGMPLIHRFKPETAHNLAILFSHYNILPKTIFDPKKEAFLNNKVMGLRFKNPIGLAAGFDKNAVCFSNLTGLGFGFVEVGTITPRPQSGNPKPRMFRLKNEKSLINRCGFNNDGLIAALNNIKKNSKHFADTRCILGINVGPNKDSIDPLVDFLTCVRQVKRYCHYITINVSSPNTPGLRDLQKKEYLSNLLQSVNLELSDMPEFRPKLLIKVSPDLSDEEINDIASIIKQENSKVDGIIISNTTINKQFLTGNSINNHEKGGISGPPVKQISTELIRKMYTLTNASIPIIGVGGVSSGKDAYEKIANGASLIQVYTAMLYHGPTVINRIKNELAEILEEKHFSNVSQAIGCEVDLKNSIGL